MIETVLSRLDNQEVKTGYHQFDDFSAWLENSNDSSRFQWNDTLYSLKKKQFIEFLKLTTAPEISQTFEIIAGQNYFLSGTGTALSLRECSREEIVFSKDRMLEFIEGDALKFPLELRTWQAGDRFLPLGFNHEKLVSDYLTDRKISFPEKDNIHVLLNKGEIVAVVGVQISDHYKIREKSRLIYKIKLKIPENGT